MAEREKYGFESHPNTLCGSVSGLLNGLSNKKSWFDSSPFELKDYMWRLWCKALGEKSGATDKEANTVATIRTILVITATVTNLIIMAGVIRHW